MKVRDRRGQLVIRGRRAVAGLDFDKRQPVAVDGASERRVLCRGRRSHPDPCVGMRRASLARFIGAMGAKRHGRIYCSRRYCDSRRPKIKRWQSRPGGFRHASQPRRARRRPLRVSAKQSVHEERTGWLVAKCSSLHDGRTVALDHRIRARIRTRLSRSALCSRALSSAAVRGPVAFVHSKVGPSELLERSAAGFRSVLELELRSSSAERVRFRAAGCGPWH